MTTATRTPKQTRKPQSRTMQFYPAARLLFISEGVKAQRSTGYLVEETTDLHNADEHVRTFLLTKPDGTSYDVLLDGPCSLCDCLGFERFGMCKAGTGCKHVAAMAKLVQVGKV